MDLVCPIEMKDIANKPVNNWMSQGLKISQNTANAMYMKIKKGRADTLYVESRAFKVARIIPLYKKNAPDECGKYRPVSLLSAFSKFLEKVICSQMMAFFHRTDLLCTTQYGSDRKARQYMSFSIS